MSTQGPVLFSCQPQGLAGAMLEHRDASLEVLQPCHKAGHPSWDACRPCSLLLLLLLLEMRGPCMGSHVQLCMVSISNGQPAWLGGRMAEAGKVREHDCSPPSSHLDSRLTCHLCHEAHSPPRALLRVAPQHRCPFPVRPTFDSSLLCTQAPNYDCDITIDYNCVWLAIIARCPAW